MPASTTHKQIRATACAKLETLREDLVKTERSLVRGRKLENGELAALLHKASSVLLESLTLLRVPATMKKERAA
jgi:hypothetical protein